MFCHSKLTLSEAHHAAFLTSVTMTDYKHSSGKLSRVSLLQCYTFLSTHLSALRPTAPIIYAEDRDNSEEEQVELSKVKWIEVGLNMTDEQKQAIARLPSKMTKRCKALMKQIICFSPEDGNLSLLLAAWVKVMKPKRADWLSVLKEIKTLGNSLFLKVFEYALPEDSFEGNIRDYTNLINAFAKENRVQDAENAFLAMKKKGFTPDQVTLTVLVHMYSKAGDFDQARKAFGEIKLLGLPVDKKAYGSMITACIRAGMPEQGEMLLRDMDATETFAGKEVYKALLRAYSTVGNCDGAQRVFNAIQLAGIVPDAKICALLVNAYCVAGRSDDALSVLDNMRSAGITPNEKCVALMLAAFQKENHLEKAVSLLMDLERDRIMIGKEGSDILSQWFQRLGISEEFGQLFCRFWSFTPSDGKYAASAIPISIHWRGSGAHGKWFRIKQRGMFFIKARVKMDCIRFLLQTSENEQLLIPGIAGSAILPYVWHARSSLHMDFLQLHTILRDNFVRHVLLPKAIGYLHPLLLLLVHSL